MHAFLSAVAFLRWSRRKSVDASNVQSQAQRIEIENREMDESVAI